jgi:predicted small metal-binding protein
MKSFTCRSVGIDCDQKFTGQTNDEILNQLPDHARDKHGITSITPDMKSKVMNAIQDESDFVSGTQEDKNLKENKGVDAA